MADYQCPLCRVDYVGQARDGLPTELAEKVIEATSCRVVSELSSWDPFFSPGVESAHPWDGKVPLCTECTTYFSELWQYDKARTKQGLRWNFTPRDKQRELELYEVYCYCAATSIPRESVATRVRRDIDEKEEWDLEEVLDDVEREYVRTKTDPYRWHSGFDYYPLVNSGKVTFSRQALYKVGIDASVVRRLKVVAIQCLKDHLSTERGFRLSQHERELNTLKSMLKLYREGLGEHTRLQLRQVASELSTVISVSEHGLEQYRNRLLDLGVLRDGKGGGQKVQFAFNKAVYDANGIITEVLGEEGWKIEKVIHRKKHQITKGRLLGSLLLQLGILDWNWKYEVLEGWVVVDDQGKMVPKIRKACDSHRKHSGSLIR